MRNLQDDRIGANVLVWMQGTTYSVATPAPDRARHGGTIYTASEVTERNGELTCNCRDFANMEFAKKKGIARGTACCNHVIDVVNREIDKDHLLADCAGVTDGATALPMEVSCYWSTGADARSTGGTRFLCGSAFLVWLPERVSASKIAKWKWAKHPNELVEVYAPTGNFLGFLAAGNITRHALRAMIATEYQAYALDYPCHKCGMRMSKETVEATALVRWELLVRGHSLVHHEGLCPSCRTDDLIPRI